MTNDDASDLLALGAAGALSDDEYDTLEQLLAADPLLAGEYRELQASALVLAEAASEAPPPSLRASVLEAINNVEQLPASLSTAQPATSELSIEASPADASALPASHPHAPSNVVPIRHRRWMIPATAAAAVFMLLVAGLLVNRFADAPSGDRMSAVLNDDDAATFVLTGSLDGLRVVTSTDESAAVLIGSDVALPDPGKVFQLWAVHDDQMVDVATFTPAATGAVKMLIDDGGGDAEWAVTMEPEGGSDQPTSDPIAISSGPA